MFTSTLLHFHQCTPDMSWDSKYKKAKQKTYKKVAMYGRQILEVYVKSYTFVFLCKEIPV